MRSQSKRNDLSYIASQWRLVDNHAMILFAEAKAIQDRIHNLERLWRSKAKLGLLPDSERVGILQYVKDLALGKSKTDRKAFYVKLRLLFDEELLSNPHIHQFPDRNFEDIVDLDDLLHAIHRDLAICERAYWQRLERFEIYGKIPLVDSAVAEYGDIQQIYNAADFLCSSYFRNITGKSPWTGLVVFGQYHEFRRRRGAPLFFAPNYVKTFNYRMWNYFSHEVSHQVIEGELASKAQFKNLLKEIVDIISTAKRITRQVLPNYLANELLADIISTLIAGEEYILTLSELKYFPSIILGERKLRPHVRYIVRSIRSPMFLRALVSCWTLRLAWGFSMKTLVGEQSTRREDIIFREVLEKIKQEDNIVEDRVKKAADLTEELPAKSRLRLCLRQLNCIHRESLKIVAEILKRGIIPKVKKFVEKDFYGTSPDEYYFTYTSNNRGLRTEDLYHLSKKRLIRTSWAGSIDSKRKQRLGEIDKITGKLSNFVVAQAEPRDVIAALSKISRGGKVIRIGPRTPFDHVAILTIALDDEARAERFPQPCQSTNPT